MKHLYLALLFSIFVLSFAVNAGAQTATPSNQPPSKDEKQKTDKPLKIKKQPQPQIGTCSDSMGHVALQVTFDKSAKITNIEVASSTGCQSFEKRAVEAAKRITVQPEIKNGEPITVVKRVEYTYFTGGRPGKK